MNFTFNCVENSLFKDFDCFKTLKSEIISESEFIEYFIANAEEGQCASLPVLSKLLDAFYNEMLVKDSRLFFKDLKPFIVDIYPETERRFPNRASMSSQCQKKAILEYLDFKHDKKIPKNLNVNCRYDLMAKSGNVLHCIYQRLFEMMGLIVYDENGELFCEHSIVDDKYNSSGHMDFVGNLLNIYNIDLLFVGEIKTTGANSMLLQTAEGYEYKKYTHKIDKIINKDQPVEDHLSQANFYMSRLGLDYEIFFYADRSTFDNVFFIYKKDTKIVKEINERFKAINNFIKEKTFPKVRTAKDRCRFCRFTNICKDVKTFRDIERIIKDS